VALIKGLKVRICIEIDYKSFDAGRICFLVVWSPMNVYSCMKLG